MTVTKVRSNVSDDTSSARRSRALLIVGVLALVVGVGSVLGGIGGAVYTYRQAVAQNIVTPDDAAIPGVPVRGPLSMWAQADIITHHQLARTDGLYYSEMPREVPAVDDAGQPVLDENGEQVMVPNEARASWLDATTLTTALSLGIISYALSAFAVAAGVTLAAVGWVLLHLRRRAVLL